MKPKWRTKSQELQKSPSKHYLGTWIQLCLKQPLRFSYVSLSGLPSLCPQDMGFCHFPP